MKKVFANLKKSKSFSSLFFIFFFIVSFTFAEENKLQENSSTSSHTVVTILNALKSTNVKDEENGEDIILFEGSVKISVEKDQTKTVISSDQISYNRKREMLYAEGNVVLEQTEKSGSVSSITATSVLFNTSTLEGVFDDGRIVQKETNSLNLPTGSTLVVSSDLFARNTSGTIAFNKGELTFCNADHPHWKIKASRIWLLPGNEFAFFNAVLFMDNIPVMYLPAFYYPKDELVFNPVFGFKNRQGMYVQTTTYLLGRKPLEEKSSTTNDENNVANYFNFIKPSKLMDQELQGIVLHNLDTVYSGDNSTYLKLMADWYANLGAAIGLDGVFKPKNVFSDIKANFLLGFGNTVFPTIYQNIYLPYSKSGKKYYEKSNFMGIEIPFRYKANLEFSMNSPFSLSLKMPIYSDPFFNYDYGDRKETMDWFSYLLNNPLAENTTLTEQQKLDASEITSFVWQLSGSYNLPLSEKVKPYIKSISFSTINSEINFRSKFVDPNSDYISKEDNYNLYSPQRKFFIPSQITPIKLSAQISGTIFSYGKSSSNKSFDRVKYPVDLIAPTDIALNKNLVEENSSNSDSALENSSEKNLGEEKSTAEKKEPVGFSFEKDGLPKLELSVPKVSSNLADFSFDVNYSVATDFTSQFTYSSEGINKAAEFNWDRIQSSYIYLKVPVELSDSLSLKNNFFTMTNKFTFTPIYQTHPYISSDTKYGGYSKENINSMKKSDYSATSMEIYNTNSLSIKPFIYYSNFKDTGLSYNTSIKLLRTKFIGDADNPAWDTLTVDPTDKDSITGHSLDLKLAATELGGDFGQSLTITSSLPPQLARYYGTLKFVFPFITVTGELGVKKNNQTDNTWVKEPFRQSASILLFDKKLSFTQSYNYDLEKDHPDALKLALSYKGLQLAYTMSYTTPYYFDEAQGWLKENKDGFIPYNASIAYNMPANTFKMWKNRISIAPTLSTSLVVDFVKPTNSYFVFSPGLVFNINKVLNISFSATSRNDVLYRYVQGSLGHPGRIPGEENIFKDLMNSFRFDDESLRKASGFKLKSLNFKITHDLHDWDLNCEFKIEPRLVTPTTGSKYYDFSPYCSISVVWRPMDSMKAEIVDDYGTWKLK